jgi:hypothetical protein
MREVASCRRCGDCCSIVPFVSVTSVTCRTHNCKSHRLKLATIIATIVRMCLFFTTYHCVCPVAYLGGGGAVCYRQKFLVGNLFWSPS